MENGVNVRPTWDPPGGDGDGIDRAQPRRDIRLERAFAAPRSAFIWDMGLRCRARQRPRLAPRSRPSTVIGIALLGLCSGFTWLFVWPLVHWLGVGDTYAGHTFLAIAAIIALAFTVGMVRDHQLFSAVARHRRQERKAHAA